MIKKFYNDYKEYLKWLFIIFCFAIFDKIGHDLSDDYSVFGYFIGACYYAVAFQCYISTKLCKKLDGIGDWILLKIK